MKKSEEEVILKVARRVRKELEDLSFKERGSKSLCGYCAIGSAELFTRLERLGFKPKIAVFEEFWGSHAFILVNDHILDVTATQFQELGNTKVVLIHERLAEQYEFYTVDKIFSSAEELIEYQQKQGWPEDQTAPHAGIVSLIRKSEFQISR